MNIVILTPIYQARSFWNAAASKLYKLNPQPERWIFAENNSTDGTLEIVSRFKRKKEILRLWFRSDAVNYCETRYDLIAIMRQLLLQRARRLNPDYAVFLDSDISVLTPDLLERLTAWPGADIIGAKYLRAYPQGIYLACLFPTENKEQPFGIRLHPRTKEPLEGIVAMSGGCLCLSRRVFQDRRVNFYPVKRSWTGDVSEDYGYCLEARMYGYRIFLENTIRLSHWLTQKHVEGKAWRVNEKGEPLPFVYA